MVIDFHSHIFPEKIASRTIEILEGIAHVKAFSNGKEEGLLSSMEAAGVDVSLVLPVVTKPEQFASVSHFAAQLNEAYQDRRPRLFSFGGIHPESADYKEKLRAIRDMGLRGIKLHPDYQETYFDDIRYMRILDYASELGLISLIHAGVDIGFPEHVHCTPQMARRVLDEVAPQNMVLAHYGGFAMWEDVEELLAGRDVYFDTAYTLGFLEDEVFLRILKKHGADKVLFATDSPWSGQRESLDHLMQLPICPEDRDKILWRNAERLLQG